MKKTNLVLIILALLTFIFIILNANRYFSEICSSKGGKYFIINNNGICIDKYVIIK